MNSRQCLLLAERMDTLLQATLGCGVQPQRMLADALYARDVLLVCDAHAGSELQALARDWRAAWADAAASTSAAAPAPAPAPTASTRAARARPSAQGNQPAARTADDQAPAPRPPQHSRPADSGRPSFFDRFRPSGPASLPAGRHSTRPLTLGLDGPDTWPPEADGPLPEALDPDPTRPAPAADTARRPQATRSAWFSPARWFDRGPR